MLRSQLTQAPGPTKLESLPPTSAPSEAATERTQRHLANLQELAELGMKLARRTAEEFLEPPTSPEKTTRPDPRDVFSRLARTVRDCNAMEARLAAGKLPDAPSEQYQPANTQDPRREFISEYIHDAIEDSNLPKPERGKLHNQVEPIIDEQLAADPEITRVGGAIAADICNTLGIPYKSSRMPDELLVLPGQTVLSAYAELTAARAAKAKVHDPPQE